MNPIYWYNLFLNSNKLSVLGSMEMNYFHIATSFIVHLLGSNSFHSLSAPLKRGGGQGVKLVRLVLGGWELQKYQAISKGDLDGGLN